ncbi:hypothetical protein [Stenotrophomonas sp. MH181796]|uniref:hypothetical protein n=1 Tax=Stenotrophomonas sp. MH181796 TaxID=2339228 RepID=UPI00129CA060|nr:hypothetical protein [Stenotrophomonas sp. MH181796]
MANEMLSVARDFYNATVADPAVTIRCQSAAARDAVTAAGERLRLALLDQRSVFITTDNLQVVATPAGGAHEVQPEAVDVGLYLVEPGEHLAAANALEHGSGVRPEHDGEVTAHG